ncbi:MAG: phosphomannomutase/phosphoglucomutase [Gammaproteobacteria bacterium]|nr:phosphomannomutase/phosphoglucomutase [Gammaproteobacteria bacterium]
MSSFNTDLLNTQLDPTIFKAYDIRGIVDKNLTTQAAYTIGLAFGSEALVQKQTTVVVARDGRLSGPSLIDALSQGLRDSGIDVINIGRVPTPVLYFSTFHLNTGTGIMVTGSHNPPDYNGLKMVMGGVTLSGEAIQELRKRIEAKNFSSGAGAYEEQDVVDAYLKTITDDIKLNNPPKIVVDCGNGVAGELAPRLYRELGCEVTELFCEIDGNFPNHHPDPSQPDTLVTLIDTVKQKKADVGFGFDGDGDRLGVVSPSGEIIWPDRQMILYSQDILARAPGSEIIFDIKCSRNLDQAISEAGGKPTMWKTGHSFIKAKLKESGAPLAGEMSGHIFFKERWFGFDDALYTGARMLEILSKDERHSLDIFNSLPNMVNTPELKVHMNEGEHHEFMLELQQTAEFDDARVTKIDGLRVDFDNGWGLVRASNTTPCLVIRFEGEDESAMNVIQERFRDLFKRLNEDLILPF